MRRRNPQNQTDNKSQNESQNQSTNNTTTSGRSFPNTKSLSFEYDITKDDDDDLWEDISTLKRRQPSVVVLQDFTLRYHLRIIFRETYDLIKYLIHGTSKWIFQLTRLLCFVVALLPAFVVFFLFYTVTSDRIAVPYRHPHQRTSRHYLDIYGSTTSTKNNNNNSNTTNNNDNKPPLKPVIFFLTGGAWIIGYKMWGTLMARTLVAFGILVVIPDYRNFPQTDVNGMLHDADLALEWTCRNIEKYGGDPSQIVLAGQSAGAHMGACLILNQIRQQLATKQNIKRSTTAFPTTTHWKTQELKGFIAVSGPYDLVHMQTVLHDHGLDKSIVNAMFCHNLAQYSPTVVCQQLQKENDTTLLKAMQTNFPPTTIIHGQRDKTVPWHISQDFYNALLELKLHNTVSLKLYPAWSHTDPILEAPFEGNHLFHRDVYDIVYQLTKTNNSAKKDSNKAQEKSEEHPLLKPFDENHSSCQQICPTFLVNIARFCNPF